MIVEAVYTPRLAPELKDNAFAEALPPRMSWAEFCSHFRLSHSTSDEDRKRPSPERLELLEHITSFFVPMTHHFEAYNALLSKMEKSYVGRDPNDPGYWVGVTKKRALVVKASIERQIPTADGRHSAALLGTSGTGKTEIIKIILSVFPEGIKHRNYKGHKLDCFQIPHVRIEVDRNTTVIGLCGQVFIYVDRILGTQYTKDYKGEGEQGKMAGVVTVCHLHGIALILVDEIQEMSLKKSKGEDAIASFMLNLANTSGPFVLFVGTPQAKLLIRREFHQIRRRSSFRDWTTFSPDSGDWQDFLNELFQCRLTRGAFDGESLRDTFYELTRGIPDLAIELFRLTQNKLILHEGPDNPEIITPVILKEIAKVYLKREMDAIAAADRLAQARERKDAQELKRALENSNEIPSDLEFPQVPVRQPRSASNGHANSSARRKPASRPVVSDSKVKSSLGDIAGINDGVKVGTVSQLRDAGMIKSPLEFL